MENAACMDQFLGGIYLILHNSTFVQNMKKGPAANSIGNRLLAHIIGVMAEIDLPNRVELVPELECFVGSLP